MADYGYGAIQATFDGVANTPLSLNPNGGGVGIQTTNVTNSLTIGQGQGAAIADGWATYSSRRFKTNIQTLTDSLGKVEKLRGVSYTLKATGKREIGVIAEEVGAVVPEVVDLREKWRRCSDPSTTPASPPCSSRPPNSNRPRSPASRRELQTQAELTNAMHLIKTEQAQIHQQAATISSLKAQVTITGPKLSGRFGNS